jgi:hypothetical protein
MPKEGGEHHCHYHEYNELYLVSRGKAKILNAGGEWYVQARDIVCIKAGDEHDILEVYGDEDFELFWLYEPGPDGARLGHLVECERPRAFTIRTTSGPTPFVYRYRFSPKNGETLVELDAEVELPGVAVLVPLLARRVVKSGVDDNFATLKEILEVRPLRAREHGPSRPAEHRLNAGAEH